MGNVVCDFKVAISIHKWGRPFMDDCNCVQDCWVLGGSGNFLFANYLEYLLVCTGRQLCWLFQKLVLSLVYGRNRTGHIDSYLRRHVWSQERFLAQKFALMSRFSGFSVIRI